MICKFCGNVIEDNSDFCFICGQKVVSDAPAYAAEVYSQQPQGAPAQIMPEVAPVAAQPVYAAPAQPVYAAPAVQVDYAAPAQPVYAAPEVPEEPKAKGKKGKKAKKAKKEKKAPVPGELSKVNKILTGFFAAIFIAVAGILSAKSILAIVAGAVLTGVVVAIYYKKYKQAMDGGYEVKALDILNTATLGLCIGMGVAVLFLIKNFVF